MTRVRKFIIAAGVVATAAGATAFGVPALRANDGIEAAQVASIRGRHEFQDPALLAKAWELPVARLYRTGLDYQRNGSLCGPTSVVNVMRSLGRGADQSTVLAETGISTLLGFLPSGVTLEQLGHVARKNLGTKVVVLRDPDLATFREHIARSNDPSSRYVVNFSRRPLFGEGGGHFSPIAGYLAEDDLVFVIDVNEDYKPWLVKPERLYEAMNTVDGDTDKKRGLLVIETEPASQ